MDRVVSTKIVWFSRKCNVYLSFHTSILVIIRLCCLIFLVMLLCNEESYFGTYGPARARRSYRSLTENRPFHYVS